MFPTALHHVARSSLGPLALYAPRAVGSVTLWRGFPSEPWSPDIDLVAATGASVDVLVGAGAADARYLVDAQLGFVARRASRGVRLSDVLAASEGAVVPPVELAVRVALALLRPGPRVSGVTGPAQIVISFDGEVHVDGLDPEAQMRAWAPAAVDRCDAELVAACAAGVDTWLVAHEVVQRWRAPQASSSPMARLVRSIYDDDRDCAVAELARLPKAKDVVAGVVRALFPTRAKACDEMREELAMLDRRVWPAWEKTIELEPPLAQRAMTFSSMRADADHEVERVRAETEAYCAQLKAPVDAMRALLAPAVVKLPRWRRLPRFRRR